MDNTILLWTDFVIHFVYLTVVFSLCQLALHLFRFQNKQSAQGKTFQGVTPSFYLSNYQFNEHLLIAARFSRNGTSRTIHVDAFDNTLRL